MTTPAPPNFPLREFLGFDIERGEGRATATMTVGDPHLNPNAVAHGAALFAMVDTIMGAATVSILDDEHRCATIEVQMRFLRAAFPGTVLRAEATVLSAGRRVVRLDARVTNGDGALVAAATGSFAVIPAPPGAAPR